jgi:hypothetical protein
MSTVASKGQHFSGTSSTASPMLFHMTAWQYTWSKADPIECNEHIKVKDANIYVGKHEVMNLQ